MDSQIPSDHVPTIHIVGGGLAGCEAAWQLLQAGLKVTIHEMRPVKSTGAHKTGRLAELVCSNSLKSTNPATAPGQLKVEMAAFNSIVLKAAEKAKVPAGQALAVDRDIFSRTVTQALESHPAFTRINEEVETLPTSSELEKRNECWIVATGPLTSAPLAAELERLSGNLGRLFFYDAIAPVIAADSIAMDRCFRASRYDKNGSGSQHDGDYLNLPLDKTLYETFVDAIQSAEYMPLHSFEDVRYFESCLPIEVMVERGRDTLRFGPMKPVGLNDPKTGRRPYAAVQLRLENKEATMYSMVGFQTKMKWPEQKRIFSMLPGLENAEFLRFGSVHRNTYIQSPIVLSEDLSFRREPRLFLAGQLTGVEGYTESAATGILAARAAAARVRGYRFPMPPETTVIGSLAKYVTKGGLGDFQPMNANLGLLPSVPRRRGESKPDKKARQCQMATQAFNKYVSDAHLA